MTQLPTHYTSSTKGAVPIAGMVTEHIQNALGALQRRGGDPATVQALQAELRKRGAS